MRILLKLQRKTLLPLQIIGYTIALLIGTCIILTSLQLFADLKPLLMEESGLFNHNALVINKKVSIFKTLDKEKIYFTNKELEELENQDFVANLSEFKSAAFRITASNKQTKGFPVFYTDLFFESIPSKYLNVSQDLWKWDPANNFIPIIIPEDYLKLYNFGFAESQGLPVLSKNLLSQIGFNIELTGKGKTRTFDSKIVEFSNSINSILVPEEFLFWANKEFGRAKSDKTSRILVELENPADESFLAYLNEHNYAANQTELEYSKLLFFFKSAFYFVLAVAMLIIVLSVSSVVLSINILIQKNRETILNLHNIGYQPRQIALYYQTLVSMVTLIVMVVSVLVSQFIRNFYQDKFNELFNFKSSPSLIVVLGIILTLVLLIAYNLIIITKIKNNVKGVRN